MRRFGQLPTQPARWQQQFDPSTTARRVRLILVLNAPTTGFYLQDEINFDNFIGGVMLFRVVLAIGKDLQCVQIRIEILNRTEVDLLGRWCGLNIGVTLKQKRFNDVAECGR